MNESERLQKLYDAAENVVFFGGAGVSTESGIPDFRSADGLYNKFSGISPEEILSHHYFEIHTEEFFEFYRDRMLPLEAMPNPAHAVLARMEQSGKLLGVITQNIDGLHQKAGSVRVAELHGSVYRNRCESCGKTFGPEFVRDSDGVPRCPCGGIVKPEVVLYGESLPEDTVETALNWISHADLIIVAGTSLTVYPAAGFLQYRRSDSRLVLINRTATQLDGEADLVIRDKVGETLGSLSV